jgi:hypothetical protein
MIDKLVVGMACTVSLVNSLRVAVKAVVVGY